MRFMMSRAKGSLATYFKTVNCNYLFLVLAEKNENILVFNNKKCYNKFIFTKESG